MSTVAQGHGSCATEPSNVIPASPSADAGVANERLRSISTSSQERRSVTRALFATCEYTRDVVTVQRKSTAGSWLNRHALPACSLRPILETRVENHVQTLVAGDAASQSPIVVTCSRIVTGACFKPADGQRQRPERRRGCIPRNWNQRIDYVSRQQHCARASPRSLMRTSRSQSRCV
jgi:hypothetical protein